MTKSEKPVVDFDALAYADTAVWSVPHPNPKIKAPLGTITVAGPGHPQVLEWQEGESRRVRSENKAYRRELQKWKDDMASDAEPPETQDEKRSVADWRRMNAERLAAYIVDADFRVKLGGKDIELTRETAVSILENPRLSFVFDGLSAFVNNLGNFTEGSAKA